MTNSAARPDSQIRSPWRDPRFRVFATGNFINNVGEGAYKVALPLYAYEATGSLAVMSLLAALAPATLLLSPVLGVYVDRWGPRAFVVPGLLVQLVAAVALVLHDVAGEAQVLALFVFGALVQVGGELYRAGWMAGVPSMFPGDPARARGALSTLFVLSNVLGPLLLAALAPLIGYLGVLTVNAATFLAPIAVWMIGVHPARRDRSDGRSSLRSDLVLGWRAVRSERRVLYVKLCALPLHFISGSGMIALFYYFLADELDAGTTVVGVAQAAANVGALAASLYVTARADLSSRALLAVSAIGMSLVLMIMPTQGPLGFAVLMTAFFGLRAAVTVVSEMILVRFTSQEVLGRAAGLFNLMDGLPLLAAPLVIPLLEDVAGPRGALVMLGAIGSTSVVLLAFLWRQWQSGDGTPAARAATVASAAAADAVADEPSPRHPAVGP